MKTVTVYSFETRTYDGTSKMVGYSLGTTVAVATDISGKGYIWLADVESSIFT